MTKQLVIDAMGMAMTNEHPAARLIFHTDRGSQYASYAFRIFCDPPNKAEYERHWNCYDNACAESFFATIKKELIHRRRFLTRATAALAIVNYVVAWYNPKRIHSALGDLSPMEFERQYYNRSVVAAQSHQDPKQMPESES